MRKSDKNNCSEMYLIFRYKNIMNALLVRSLDDWSVSGV